MSADPTPSPPEHHAKTVIRGGRPSSPRLLSIGTQSVDAFLLSMQYTTYGQYAVKAASLGPLELVLVGTTLELLTAVAELAAGIVADAYSRRLSVIVGLCLIGIGSFLMGPCRRSRALRSGACSRALGIPSLEVR